MENTRRITDARVDGAAADAGRGEQAGGLAPGSEPLDPGHCNAFVTKITGRDDLDQQLGRRFRRWCVHGGAPPQHHSPRNFNHEICNSD